MSILGPDAVRLCLAFTVNARGQCTAPGIREPYADVNASSANPHGHYHGNGSADIHPQTPWLPKAAR